MSDLDGVQVTYRGQLYRRIAVEPYIRDDGSTTQLATWQSQCPVCGEALTIQTTRLHRLREPAPSIGGLDRQCAGQAMSRVPTAVARLPRWPKLGISRWGARMIPPTPGCEVEDGAPSRSSKCDASVAFASAVDATENRAASR
jgi:hypothetical protein